MLKPGLSNFGIREKTYIVNLSDMERILEIDECVPVTTDRFRQGSAYSWTCKFATIDVRLLWFISDTEETPLKIDLFWASSKMSSNLSSNPFATTAWIPVKSEEFKVKLKCLLNDLPEIANDIRKKSEPVVRREVETVLYAFRKDVMRP